MAQNNTIHNILEVVVGTADIRSSNQVKSGKLRKIATRIYTNLKSGCKVKGFI